MAYNYSPSYVFILIICAAITLVSSCTYTIRDIETRKFKAHPVPADQVQIVRNEEDVAHCLSIASLKAKGGSNELKINKLREEAGKLGANVLHVIAAKPRELTNEDVAGTVLGYVVVTIVVGALTGDTASPSSSLEPDSVDAKAFRCNE